MSLHCVRSQIPLLFVWVFHTVTEEKTIFYKYESEFVKPQKQPVAGDSGEKYRLQLGSFSLKKNKTATFKTDTVPLTERACS